MIKIYLHRINGEEQKDLGKLDPGRRERVLQAGDPGTGAEIREAGMLLHRAVCMELGLDPDEEPYFETAIREHGKPILKDPRCAGLHMNLSHSGGIVCCAVAGQPVGVDIQKLGGPARREQELRIAKRFFAEEEYRELQEAADPDRSFAQLWTAKESRVKLRGERLVEHLDEPILASDRIVIVDGEDYCLAICTEEAEEYEMRIL